MAFQLAEAYVEFNTRGLGSTFGAIDRVSGAFRGAIGFATSFQAKLAAIGVGVSAGSMLKLAADAETAQVKFEVLLGSADKAIAMVSEIDQFAAKTPFAKLEIADATQKLLAFGSAEDEVMDQLRAIGDISALTGNRIGELAEIYGKAQVQGRVFAEDINQLTGRGIPIIDELAKQFGVAESEVRELVSSGKVTAANIQQAFTDMTTGAGRFAGGMETLSSTITGRFSTALDNIRLQATAVGSVFNPLSGAVLDFVIDSTEALGTILGPSLDLIGDTIEDVFGEGFGGFDAAGLEQSANELREFTAFALDEIGGLVETGGPLFEELAGLAGDVFSIVGDLTFDGTGGGGFDVIESMVPTVTSAVQFVRSSLATLDPAFDALSNLVDVTVGAVVSTIDTLAPSVDGLFGTLSGGGGGTVDFLAGAIDSVSSFVQFVEPAIPVVVGIFGAIAGGSAAVNLALSVVGALGTVIGTVLSPLGLAAAGVAFLAAAIASSESAVESFENLASTSFEVVGDLMTATGEIAGSLLSGVLSLWGGFDSGVGVMENVGNGIGSVIDWLTGLISDVGFAARNWDTLLAIMVESVGLFVSNAVEYVSTFALNIVELLGFAVDNWRELLTDMANGTAAVLTNIGRNLGEFFAAVQSWLAGDGFNFQAVDLFDGFKSSLEELPELTEAQTQETTAELDSLYAELAAADAQHLAEQRRRRQEAADKEAADRQKARDAEIAENQRREQAVRDSESEETANPSSGDGKAGFSGLEEFAKSVQLAAFGVDEKSVEKEQLEEQKKTNTILSTGLGVEIPETPTPTPVVETAVETPIDVPAEHPAMLGEIPGFEWNGVDTTVPTEQAGSGLSSEQLAEIQRFRAERQGIEDSQTQRPVAPHEDDGIGRAIALARQQAALDAAGQGGVVNTNQGNLGDIIAFGEANLAFSQRNQPALERVEIPPAPEEFTPASFQPSRRREIDPDAPRLSRREVYLASQGRSAPDPDVPEIEQPEPISVTTTTPAPVGVDTVTPEPISVTTTTPAPVGVETVTPEPINVGLRQNPEGVSATAEDPAQPDLNQRANATAGPSVIGAATEPPQSPSGFFDVSAAQDALRQFSSSLTSFVGRLNELSVSGTPEQVSPQDRAAVGFDAQLRAVHQGVEQLVELESKSLDQLRTTHQLLGSTGIKIQNNVAVLG